MVHPLNNFLLMDYRETEMITKRLRRSTFQAHSIGLSERSTIQEKQTKRKSRARSTIEFPHASLEKASTKTVRARPLRGAFLSFEMNRSARVSTLFPPQGCKYSGFHYFQIIFVENLQVQNRSIMDFLFAKGPC